jgi:hypothetical protein
LNDLLKKRHIFTQNHLNGQLRSAAHSLVLSFCVEAQLRPILTEVRLKDQEF